MPEQASILSTIVRVLLILSLGPFALGYFYWAWRMIRGRKQGVTIVDLRFSYNPFNLAFRPSLLTDEGLRARRRFFICSAGMPLAIVGLVAMDRWWPASAPLQRTGASVATLPLAPAAERLYR